MFDIDLDAEDTWRGDGEFLDPGHIIAGRYAVRSLLSTGGMGAVYLAEHLRLQRLVALKMLRPHAMAASVAKRFRAEARRTGALRHPNIVEIFDADELDDGGFFLAMEFIDGQNLADEMKRRGPFPLGRALWIAHSIACALAASHEAKILHRDLKPANVMITRSALGDELVKVLDFGVATEFGVGPDAPRATAPGLIIGTPAYMAPEQASSLTRGGPPADIYALAVVLFEMLTGDIPLDDDDPFALITRKCTEPAPSLRDHDRALPESLITLVDDALEIDPTKRPRSMEEFIARLDASGASVEHYSPPALPPLARRRHRADLRGRRVGVALAASAAFALIAGLGFVQSSPPPSPEPTRADVAAAVAAPPVTRHAVPNVRPPPNPSPTPKPAPTRPVPTKHEPVATTNATAPEPNTPVSSQRRRASRGRSEAPKERTRKQAPEPSAAECARLHERRTAARRAHQWSVVLESTTTRSCWESERSRVQVRTKALLELGRFSECAHVAPRYLDAESERWVALCRARSGSKG